MLRREHYFAMLNDNRLVYPFAFGAEFVGVPNAENSVVSMRETARQITAESDAYFFEPHGENFCFQGLDVTWQSAIETVSEENNVVRAKFFKSEKDDGKRAVIILPHWNAPADSYVALCKVLNKVGVSALRLTLPYHEKRMPPELERADWLVSTNLGRTIQSVRQAVIDTRSAINFLVSKGYERIGIVGTSIGSCTAFLAFVHDERIKCGVFNHVSGYFADVVWNGLSTYHVKDGLKNDISLDDLREIWSPISPMAYIDKLARQKPRPQRFIYTRYDLTFPFNLSQQMMKEFRRRNIAHDETILPCGHYTLGEKPWVYIDGWKIVTFLRKNL